VEILLLKLTMNEQPSSVKNLSAKSKQHFKNSRRPFEIDARSNLNPLNGLKWAIAGSELLNF